MLILISAAVGYGLLTANGGFPGQEAAFAAPVTGLSMPAAATGSTVAAADATVLRAPAINRTLRAEQPVSAQQREEADQFVALGITPTATPDAAPEDALVRAASSAPAPQLPPYQVYTVSEGDTVSAIAGRFGVSPDYIIANNAEIRDSNLLTLGQSIIIPAGDGILHEVRYGETLSDIASRYDVGLDAITSFASNGISDPGDITETQLVYVPGGQIPTFTPPPAAELAPEAGTGGDDGSTDSAGEDSGGGSSGGGGGGFVSTGPSSGAGVAWPVNGPISSYYSSGHPLGIDIDGYHLGAAAIGAATEGTVVFAGGNACCSYGLYVVVVSSGGIETLYAHLSSISVSAGESVSQGQVIGIIGDTGYSTGVHLHFEVIDNGVRQNPLDYLP